MFRGTFAIISIVMCVGALSSLRSLWASEPMGENKSKPWAVMGQVAEQKPTELDGVGIDEKLGQDLDSSLSFVDDNGQPVQLSRYLGRNKPIILSLVYFNCPSLCNLHLNGLNEGFKQLDWPIGDRFEVVSVSINPQENAQLAKTKKASYLQEYGRSNVEAGWHFLTGTQDQITKLAENIGFKYKYDSKTKEYLHTSAAVIITPSGKISRYLHGVFFEPKTLRLSLVEASNGLIGEVVDSIMLFCFRYDPNKRTYAFYAYNIMKIGAGLAALALFAFLLPAWKKMRTEPKS